ncbi:PREDICTED: formimidoyltransferase-cyclodeaminase-like [Branchiostoma belcheri]|uniref:Formimidoyltransferase-cyclodeaminase n=1 Tax=Branchiostoma belcheri TaxID=7741 RepID=A0A6P4ZYZ6_BRABE|nr:PREDICTED: formimidoyltransferase-cyclodeaminase-like [Branchiostoma belcheri]
MSRIVECVPNFSEGRHKEVIEAIANAIASTDGVSLLDVDPGPSTNRTVYTFVGSPESVVEGAMNGARAASQLIDMTRHSGEHPRMGALDVCPFIPVRGVTEEDCIQCANEFGKQLAEELGVPVYLYGKAAKEEKRVKLPSIRAGEYEGLEEKLKDPAWQPDYGPAEFIPSWGATATGCRKFLIAWNVNLLATKEQAHRIALNLREQGRGTNEPGRLKCVQGIGWWLEEANMAQISMNLTDFDVTPLHTAYEEACKDAKELNLPVVGSQIVGLVPLQAIMLAAEFYMQKDNLFLVEEDQKVRLAIDRLGLNSLGPFNPKERIIEYMIRGEDEPGPLASTSVYNFIKNVGARSPAPGGGSVSACVAAMGAALGAMVAFMTYGKRQFEQLDSKMRQLIPPLYTTMNDLIPFIDKDTTAFNDYMAACKLPKGTPEEQAIRDQAMQGGLKKAIQVPLAVMQTANRVWTQLQELAQSGNFTTMSDLQVGARSLETGVWGAYHNVMINLRDIKDEQYKQKITAEAEAEVQKAQEGKEAVLKIISERKE